MAFTIEGGGADQDRTDDIVIANDALSQLNYGPTVRKILAAFRGRVNTHYCL